jgi:ubiquilin
LNIITKFLFEYCKSSVERGGVFCQHNSIAATTSTITTQEQKEDSLFSIYYYYYYYIMTVPSITLLHVRMSSGARLSVELNDSLEATTVLQVKEKISRQQTDCPPERQRLIYKGRVLDEERTLSDYGVLAGSTLHLVKSRPPADGVPAPAPVSASANNTTTTTTQPPRNPFSAPAPTAAAQPTNNPFGGMPMPPGGMPSPEQMSQMMNNPMVQSMLDNPEFLRNMMESNPQIQAMLDSNPQ